MTASPESMAPEAFDELDAILDDLRTRYDETPQWEFCEGFMAALICCRRPIPVDEYLGVLLAIGDDAAGEAGEAGDSGSFADAAQAARFQALWAQRWSEVAAALDTPIESLDDDSAYAPEVMDVRGAIASLPPEERAEVEGEDLPAFAQVWALGFMFAVENWPEEWAAPRDRDAAKWLNASLEALVALTEDDEDEPTLSALSEDGPPSVSEARLDAYAAALWAVYDLRELWRSIGPRVETVRRAAEPGRNDPCPCGSGKKYKKCHGAAA
ncbi:YecA family protein [Variovorax terrae]|uniref:UPF0149 family protein n=1 Tax=Variovorax terrae TaxID=2923278 RepID=A0A9X1W1F6_9BURK|nr:YecA family protein [Variovorax terrae]MCJ0766049.1 UPF0149 family protein [Variovorax terrae]